MRQVCQVLALTLLLTGCGNSVTSSVGGVMGEAPVVVTGNSTGSDREKIELFDMEMMLEDNLKGQTYIEDAVVILMNEEYNPEKFDVSVMIVSENITADHQIRDIIRNNLTLGQAENIFIVDQDGNNW